MGYEGEWFSDKVNKMKLTAIIIFSESVDKNQLEMARRSVGFADEVMVEEIKEPIKDFAKIRNEALSRAKNEWVMFVDADEEVDQQLAREIRRVIEFSIFNFQFSNIGYFMRRKDRFLGRWLEHGETASVKFLRLARKDAGKWERPAHEVWKVGGRVGELKNPIWHYSHQSIDVMVEKLDRYSEIEAKYRSKRQANRLSGYQVITEMIAFPVGKFLWNYVSRLGFLDGIPGFIHAGMMSFHSFLVRSKLLARSESTKSSE